MLDYWPERAEAIRAALAQHLDHEAARERLSLFRRVSADLQVTCLILFFLVLLLPPLLVWVDSPFPFLTLAVCYLGVMSLGVLQFRRAHKLFYPEESWERFKSTLLVFFSPVDAVHARDKVSRALVGEFSPLAVARAACAERSFRQFAGDVWRDLEYPLPPAYSLSDPAAQDTERWFHDCLRGQVAKFLADAGVATAALVEPPLADTPTSSSYCPRCQGQYVLTGGVCADCGLPLRALG